MIQDDPADPQYERPSKSARKRASHSLQDLGVALAAMPDAQLEQLPLPDVLRDAVLAARKITSHGALLRQRQYLGKLMRKIDVEPIRAMIEQQVEQQRAGARRFKRIETWRDQLLADPAAVPELLAQYPAADGARLRALIADAALESAQQRAPRAARQLFQYLRELTGQ